MKIFLRILSIIIEVIVAVAIFIMVVQKTPLFDRAIPGRSLPFSSSNTTGTSTVTSSTNKDSTTLSDVGSSNNNDTTVQTQQQSAITIIPTEPTIIDQPVQSGLSCTTPRGTHIADGSSIIAYRIQRANSSNECQSEIRTCQNGKLGGNFIYKTCDYIIDGQLIKSDGTREDTIAGASDSNQRLINLTKFYKKVQSTPKEYIQPQPYKDSTTLTLGQAKGQSMDNNKKGSATTDISDTLDQTTRQDDHSSSKLSCTSPRGSIISHGSFIYAYNIDHNNIQEECSMQKRVCLDGKLSGSFTYKSCNGQSPIYNNSITSIPSIIYKGTVSPYSPYIRSLSDNIRDTLLRSQKSYNNTNNTQNTIQLKNCLTPWGSTIRHNDRIIAYRLPTEINNSLCNEETRVCRDGVLGGSYTYQSCTARQNLIATKNNNETRLERNIKSIGKDANNVRGWIKGWFR